MLGKGLSECSAGNVPFDTSFEVRAEGKVSGYDASPYRKLIGSVVYIATHTRLEIAVLTNMLERRGKTIDEAPKCCPEPCEEFEGSDYIHSEIETGLKDTAECTCL